MQLTNDVKVQWSLVFLTSNDKKKGLCQTERTVTVKIRVMEVSAEVMVLLSPIHPRSLSALGS